MFFQIRTTHYRNFNFVGHRGQEIDQGGLRRGSEFLLLLAV